MRELFPIISEDAEILAINKPAGLVCHPTKGDEYSSLISRIRLYLGPAGDPHLINRLDRETSGIVLVAKSAEVAAPLRRLWENREVEKEYFGIVQGHLAKDRLTIRAPLGKDLQSAISIKDAVAENGAAAETHAMAVRRFSRLGKPFTLVRVSLLTGRKHQIRIHLQHAGYPIVGDKLYGGDENLYLAFVLGQLASEQRERLIFDNHALHAGCLRLEWRHVSRIYSCPPEPWFSAFCG